MLRRFGLCLFLALNACAHHYYYLPEVSGTGATAGRSSGVIYKIPPTGTTELKVHLRALGIHKVKDRQMVALRLSFTRPPGVSAAPKNTREFIRPSDLTLKVGDLPAIQPAYLHTMAREKDLVELTYKPSEVLELLFPLPKNIQDSKDIETYFFTWKVHYANGAVETQTARFDRNDSAPLQSAEDAAEDANYPYGASTLGMEGWTVNQDPYWWGMDPWGPWW